VHIEIVMPGWAIWRLIFDPRNVRHLGGFQGRFGSVVVLNHTPCEFSLSALSLALLNGAVGCSKVMISCESLEEQRRIQFGGGEIEDLSLISVDAEGLEASAGQRSYFYSA